MKKVSGTARILAMAILVIGFSQATTADAQFSHEKWTQVLERFVDSKGFVDYDGLLANRGQLDQYLRTVKTYSPISHPDMFPERNDRLAYYINAYNAHVFHGVLEGGPEDDSVWGFLGTGISFFTRRKIVIGGRSTSLKSLEDKIIRDGFKDPRIHAALNCASKGCPRLPRKAFLPETLDQQLTDAMREFVTTDIHCRVVADENKVVISKIFDWFEGDFLKWEKSQGKESANIIDHINRFRTTKIPRTYKVEYGSYDKSINSQ